MYSYVKALVFGAAVVGLWGTLVVASDEPDELVHGIVVVLKPTKLAKFVGKALPAGALDLPDASNDPTSDGPSMLRIRDLGGTGGDQTFLLPVGTPALGWSALGNPAGSAGYKYKGTGLTGNPCKVVLVKKKIVKAVCKGPDVTLATAAFTGACNITLSIGTGTKRYCLRFGGTTIKNEAGKFIAKGSDGPGTFTCASPSGAFLEVARALVP